jgi:hypothetical protein
MEAARTNSTGSVFLDDEDEDKWDGGRTTMTMSRQAGSRALGDFGVKFLSIRAMRQLGYARGVLHPL